MKTQKVIILFLSIIVAGVLLAFSTWWQWNNNQKTTKERLRPVPPIAEFNHGTSIRDITFSSTNPELFASAGEGNKIKVWKKNNQDGPQITLETQEDGSTSLNGIAFSPTDKWFVSKTFWTLEIWDITSGRRINFIKIPASTFAISPEGRYIVTTTNELKLWDISNPKDIKGLVLLPPEIGWKPLSLEEISVPGPTSDPPIKYHMLPNKYHHATDNQFYGSIDFSDNGKWIAAGGHIDDRIKKKSIGIIKVWDLQNKQLIKFIKRDREVAEGIVTDEYRNNIQAVDFSPNNQFLAVAAYNGLTIWTLPEWNIYHEVLDEPIFDFAFSPDGTMYAVADVKGITLWSVDALTPIALLREKDFF